MMFDANTKVEIFCNAVSSMWKYGHEKNAYQTWGTLRSWCHGASLMADLDNEFEVRDDLYLLRDIAALYEFERSEK